MGKEEELEKRWVKGKAGQGRREATTSSLTAAEWMVVVGGEIG